MNLSESQQDDIPLTRRERKRLRRQGINNESTSTRNGGLKLKLIYPKTHNQQRIFDEYNNGQHLLIHGYAGTGKTFLSLYLALDEILNTTHYNQIVIVRSVVPTRDIGFLPGNKKDKIKEYESPYTAICTELFRRGDAYELLKLKGLVDFIPTSFIRGGTINNSIVIVDESQNMNGHELDSVITRLGENSRLIVCGDYRQSDLKFNSERQGLVDFMDILHSMKSFSHIEMKQDDIVRSGLVKEYIITKAAKGLL